MCAEVSSLRPTTSSARRVLGGSRAAWTMGVAAVCCGLFALYFCQSRTAPFNSDGAANVLQARAIITGNPLLRGWWTSDVSFYTTELPEYALATAIRGLSPDVVHLCGALSYTLTVLLAVLVARGGAGAGAGWCRAAVAAGIMLAPGILGGTEVFLENPDHAGTAVPVLLLLLLLAVDTGQRGRWLVPAGACALLALAQVGDQLTLPAATVPLALVSAIRLVRRRGPADGALLAAAVVSVGLAEGADTVIRAIGGFDLRPLSGVALSPLSRVPTGASVLWRSIIQLFGANNPGVPRQAQTIRAHGLLVSMADLHVLGLLLAAAGLVAGIASFLSRRADRVTQFLVAAIIAMLAAGVFTTVLRSLGNAHEVAILLPLGAALAGRTLGSLPGHAFPPRSRGPGAARLYSVRIAAFALGAWLALNLAALCYAATWPAVQPQQRAVAAWLVGHHEHEGLAGYWQAASTTVTSGGQVLVAAITLPAAPTPAAPATAPTTTRAAAYRWESSAAWYQPASHEARFVIAVAGPAEANGLSVTEVRARFGRPVTQYRIGQEVIMLYGYNLLTRLTATSFPGPR